MSAPVRSFGPWTTPAFNAADFDMPSGTWTVEAADVATYAYIICDKTMTVAFAIQTTTVGGAADNLLQIKIPSGKTATKTSGVGLATLIDNGTRTTGTVIVSAGGAVLRIQRTDVANFTASVDNTTITGQLTFEIN